MWTGRGHAEPSTFSRSSRVAVEQKISRRSLGRCALYRPCPATRAAARSATQCNVGTAEERRACGIGKEPRADPWLGSKRVGYA